MKFAKAVIASDYNVICLFETWLNENIDESELLIIEYDTYKNEREIVDKKIHMEEAL